MGFWNRLFGKSKEKPRETEENWDQLVFVHEGVNFADEEQRSRYIMGCLEQIAEADKETAKLTGEYALVTSYLSDMEELEALPEREKQQLEQNARMIRSLEQDMERYRGKSDRMAESDYQNLRKQEQTVEEGIRKLKDAEKYAAAIKQDLKKLDVERQAHILRDRELENTCANYRGMAAIFMIATVFCLLMLAVLQFGFRMETAWGYFVAVVSGAVAVTVTFVKYLDAQKEQQKIRKAGTKLIQLQNKVKIRYVNNTNLLEYLRLKYNTDKAEKLEKLWALYQQEKEERKRFAESEAKIEYYQNQLVAQLGRYHLKDPGRWREQTAAILDKREMVEIRHELILRRQALRKQLDYNKDAASKAHDEVVEIAGKYPAFRTEILEMVDKYQRESDGIS